MCGLTGFCDFNKKLNLTSCRNATNVLKHRGPDNGNQELFDLPHVSIGLGHRRLSILDLSVNGNQPMYSENKSIAIILNGEIYNFSEIRKSLEVLGYKFNSNSDTEVIIKAYEEWGIQAVQKFIGMFAFVLVDLKKNMVYLLRDRPGVKPMYYYYKEDCILFASELKALHQYENFKKEIDHAGINFFFKYGYIPAPHTIFKNTYKLTPGNYLQINLLTKQVQKHEYWNVADHYNKPKLDISEREAEEHTEKLFTSAFEYRMVSDVPVGVFLSGGYDSSVVTAILQKNSSKKIKTFTIGFHEKKYNEAPYAKQVARYLGTEHNEYYCTTREAQDIFPLLADIYDEPFGDSSAIPTILVSRFARKQVTVALSADGGDEIFAGYNRYPQLNTINRARSMLPGILRSAISNILPAIPFKHLPLLNKKSMAFSKLEEILTSDDLNSIADTLSKHYTDKELINLLPAFNPDIKLYNDVPSVNNENDFINTLLALDYKTYMVDDILTKVDRATMSVALEGREPLLDHRIIEFVAQLPSELKYRQGVKKYLLKKIAHKYIPENLLNRPKSGFGLPVYEWFKNDLKDYLFYYINEKELAKHNLINTKYAIKIRDEFISGKNREETQIWMLLMFQMWWDRWM
jgi:asparagine synthase (glutamine-hydrolyzing)